MPWPLSPKTLRLAFSVQTFRWQVYSAETEGQRIDPSYFVQLAERAEQRKLGTPAQVRFHWRALRIAEWQKPPSP